MIQVEVKEDGKRVLCETYGSWAEAANDFEMLTEDLVAAEQAESEEED